MKSITMAFAAASMLVLAACNKQAAPAENGAASATAGADAINGTWKADLSSVKFDQKPDEFMLKDGQFSCSTCVPAIKVAADGAFHPVSGSKYFDSYAVKVVDDHTVITTSKRGDKVVGENTRTISADGKTLTGSFTDSSTPDAPPVKGSYTETRVGEAPAGAHAVSGSWMPAKVNQVSDEGLTTTYRLEGDTLHMSSPAGQSYDAKLDGTETPIKGDVGGTVASVKKVGDSYEETDKRDGKVINVATFSVGADGKLHVSSHSNLDGSTTTYTADKQ
jgi:hypothetical protein